MGRFKKALKLSHCIGQVIQTNALWKAVRVLVPDQLRDPYLNLYFERHTKIWAANSSTDPTVGDMVRIKVQDEPQSDRVQYEVRDVVFSVGRVVDPVTGRRCRGPEFINEELRRFGPHKTLPTGIDGPKGTS